jgi:hypothetical protein
MGWNGDGRAIPDAGEVERLLGVSRELLELRDRALAEVFNDDNNLGALTIEPMLRDLLRSQTLVVLEFRHVRFDEARDLEPSELRAAGRPASTKRRVL